MSDWLSWHGGRRKRRKMMADADAARDAGDKTHAAELYGALVARFPDHSGAWGQRGNMLKDLGRFDEAEAAYDRARTLDPKNPDIYLQLGHLSKLRGKPVAAIAFYREALLFDPALADAERELASMGMAAVPDAPDPAPDARPDLAENGAIVHRRLRTALSVRRA